MWTLRDKAESVCVIMIQPVSALTPKVSFKEELGGLQKPFNLRVERNIAMIYAAGTSTAIGAAMMAISRSYTSNWKNAGLIGFGTALLAMTFIAPRFLYKAGIKSYSAPDSDVFVKDKQAPKKLLNNAIDNKKKGISGMLENCSKNLVRKAA